MPISQGIDPHVPVTREILTNLAINRVVVCTGLTGGGAANFDGLDGTNIVANTVIRVLVGTDIYDYVAVAGSGVESSPDIIVPDTNSGTTFHWSLLALANAVAGSGDVTAASSFGTDNAIIAADGTGKGVQSRAITISDTGALTFPDNVRQTFNPGADAAGLNAGAHAGNPGTLLNGDVWYNSSTERLRQQYNGTTANVGTGDGDVTAASAFGTDNRLLRSDGTGKGVQASGITVDDSDNVTGVAQITATTQVVTTVTDADSNQIIHGVPQNSQSAAYTTVLGDKGKCIFHPASDDNARTFTIDSNANVAYAIGTCISFLNMINTVTIAITSDTMTLIAGSGTGTTGSRTLAAGGFCTAMKISSTAWVIWGVGLT